MNIDTDTEQDSIQRILEKLENIEHQIRCAREQQTKLTHQVIRNYEKMMDGFVAIERAFKMNCWKQVEMNEIVEGLEGLL